MRRSLSPIFAPLLLMLAACNPHAADSAGSAEAPAPPPAGGPVLAPEFGADFRLVGTEPVWSLRIDADQMVLSRPDQSDLTVRHAGPSGRDGAAEWQGEGLVARLVRKTCSDGMSDRAYHYEASVRVGDVALKGCGDSEAWFAP